MRNYNDEITAQTSAREHAKISKKRVKKSKKDGRVKLKIKGGYVTFKNKAQREQYIQRLIEDKKRFDPSFKIENMQIERV